MNFKMRITKSGSNGIALYIPSYVVKELKLKKNINKYLSADVDEEGDIVIYMDKILEKETNEDG